MCLNFRKPVLGEHLAFLSVKYGVYLAELFEAVVSARKTGEANCETLKIEYRGSVAGEAIILITQESRVVVQFRVAEELLVRKDINFESWMDTDQIRKQIARQDTEHISKGEPRPIQNLRHGMKKVNVEGRITEAAKATLVHTQYGNNVMLTNTWIEDQTGKIKLCLWNEQADSVKVGDDVQIRDGSVTTFRGERQLRLGRKGTINIMQAGAVNVKREFAESARNAIYA
jgi:replication factor A1